LVRGDVSAVVLDAPPCVVWAPGVDVESLNFEDGGDNPSVACAKEASADGFAIGLTCLTAAMAVAHPSWITAGTGHHCPTTRAELQVQQLSRQHTFRGYISSRQQFKYVQFIR